MKKKQKKYWRLHFESKETVANLYSFLYAFKVSENKKLLFKPDPLYLNRWIRIILDNIPDVDDYVNSDRGPIKDFHTTPISFEIILNSKERFIMLQICEIILTQILSEEYREKWIFNFGETEYELALKSLNIWITQLKSDSNFVKH